MILLGVYNAFPHNVTRSDPEDIENFASARSKGLSLILSCIRLCSVDNLWVSVITPRGKRGRCIARLR